MRKTELIFTSIIIVLILAITMFFSFEKYSESSFWDNILVEVHGMILDFLLIGVLLSLLLNYKEQKKEIHDLFQIIDFNRLLTTEESKYKVLSAIRDLNKKKISSIKLHECKLDEIVMPKINLKGSSIHATNFSNSNLNSSDLSHCKAEGTKFTKSVIRTTSFACTNFYRLEMHDAKGKNCDFTQANIIKSNIINCDLESSDFRQSLVHKSNFSDSNLKSTDFRGSDFDDVNFTNAILRNTKFQNCTFQNNIIFANADLAYSNFCGCIDLPLNNLILARSLQGAKFDDAIKNQLQAMGAVL